MQSGLRKVRPVALARRSSCSRRWRFPPRSPRRRQSTAAPKPLDEPGAPGRRHELDLRPQLVRRVNFIYKVAGSDGCLPTATDCSTGGGTPGDSNNLPPNYNGAQEFYTWWKGIGTSDDAAAERPARRVRLGEGPPLQHEELAAQRRRADDPRRNVRGPAGHARESQRLDARLDEPGQRRGER